MHSNMFAARRVFILTSFLKTCMSCVPYHPSSKFSVSNSVFWFEGYPFENLLLIFHLILFLCDFFY